MTSFCVACQGHLGLLVRCISSACSDFTFPWAQTLPAEHDGEWPGHRLGVEDGNHTAVGTGRMEALGSLTSIPLSNVPVGSIFGPDPPLVFCRVLITKAAPHRSGCSVPPCPSQSHSFQRPEQCPLFTSSPFCLPNQTGWRG